MTTETKTRVRHQIHMEDVVIRDAELEQLLEEREAAKKAVAEYRSLDQQSKDKIRSMASPPPFRCGRFIVAQKETPPRSVSFETASGSRISIKVLGEE